MTNDNLRRTAPVGTTPRALSALWPFMRPYRGHLVLAALFLVLAALTTLALPMALRLLIDQGLLALVDAWPPVSLTLLSAPAAASSLTWTVEFIDDASLFGTDEWWSYLANIEFAADGYHHIEAKLWRPDGKLASISRQTVTVFA